MHWCPSSDFGYMKHFRPEESLVNTARVCDLPEDSRSEIVPAEIVSLRSVPGVRLFYDTVSVLSLLALVDGLETGNCLVPDTSFAGNKLICGYTWFDRHFVLRHVSGGFYAIVYRDSVPTAILV